jgi:CDP-glucose 4,6-dehydratase
MRNSIVTSLLNLSGPLMLTGHTGFKGTWLTFLLEHLGIPVVGYSLESEKNSLYERAQRLGAIPEHFGEIENFTELSKFIKRYKPSSIIHLAAQPLVLKSYESPRQTFETNLMGTVNILDAAFSSEHVKAIMIVTSDKVYKNIGFKKPFTENDELSGRDPYSASKVATESAVSAWQQLSKVKNGPKVISVRAGNVIGGGDWAEDRIIPDLIKSYLNKIPAKIRNPNSIRPWQHVLDPLTGYLMALEAILGDSIIDTLNFGPTGDSLSVLDLINLGSKTLPLNFELLDLNQDYEANYLSLDSTLARNKIGWKPNWTQLESIDKSFIWWNKVLNKKFMPSKAINEDIIDYVSSFKKS